MTRNEQHFEQRSHRPKRALSKISDDNILGISWKEEQELRKAMYVSLRDQQQTNSDSNASNRLMTLRFQLVKQPRQTTKLCNTKLNMTKLRSTIQFKHVRKQSRSKFVTTSTMFLKTSNVSERLPHKKISKCNSGNNKANIKPPPEGNKSCLGKLSQNTSHICLRNLCHRQNPIKNVNDNNQLIDYDINKQISSNSAETFEENDQSLNTVPLNYSQRPTLITASNYLKSSLTNINNTQRKSVIRKSPYSSVLRNGSFRSEIIDKFAAYSSPKKSVHCLKRRSKPAIHPPNRLSSINEPGDVMSKCLLDRGCESDFQSPCESVPPELCQNDIRRLVSVHDFINFVCFHDCSTMIHPNTEWFTSPHVIDSQPVPRTLQSNLESSNSPSNNKRCPKNFCIPTKRNNYNSANITHIISNVPDCQSTRCSLVTRSTSLCVAKKLASIQPSPNLYTSHSPISSPLKMDVPGNCFSPNEYRHYTEENELATTILISSATSFQTSRLRVSLKFYIFIYH
ncbi:hypothetical protein EWB00_008710 [Schistosoma japonicum]|uniref:Uncharacterized protein n=1 Tax=Schistosoma japonicum TaxID=6182 RepID=A0A4Z2CPH1_SCHJA|nr:hypothetical protein EWB00_008710 [Schistosoma japonicum]